jgi:hypothetical protein
MYHRFNNRRQLRSILAIVVVSATIGSFYEPITTGALTLWGPLTGLVVGVPLVLFEVIFPLAFMRRWPFAAVVVTKSLLYTTLILLVFLGSALLYGMVHGLTLADFAMRCGVLTPSGKLVSGQLLLPRSSFSDS